jgi:phenylacetate-CoA ligase
MNPCLMRRPLPEVLSDAELRELHVQDQRWTSAAHLQRLHWSRGRIEQERRRRLRELVSLAQERSPWHQRRLVGVDPARLEESDLSRLPVMTKEEVMTNFDQIVTDRRLTLARAENHLAGPGAEPGYLLEHYRPVVSVGSSGARGVFVYDWPGWAACYAGAFRYLMRDRGGQPISMAVVGAGSAPHLARAILNTFSDPAMIRIHPVPITLPTAQLAARLSEIRPDTLFTDPSKLVELIGAARAHELTIAPRAVIAGGEPLTPEVRESAESVLGTTVLDWWVSTEAGPIGIGCGRGPRMHLSDDLIILEAVDEHGELVPAGVRSAKVLLTILYNHALPLIRYELTDEVTLLDGVCPCGSAHTLVQDVRPRPPQRALAS